MKITRGIAAVVGGIVLTAAVVLGLVYAVGGGKLLTADFRGEVDANEKVQADGNYRIGAYDEFFDRCGSIQSDEDKIENLRTERKTATPERKAQIDPSITAIQNSRSGKIRRYNADARKEATRGQFRSSDLPYQIDVDEDETTCTA